MYPRPSGMSTTLGIANVRQPAATALRMPVGESSMATQSFARTPSASAAVRYGSGCGLPLVTSSPVMTTSNVPGGSVFTTASAKRVQLIVTSACGMPALRSAVSVSLGARPPRHLALHAGDHAVEQPVDDLVDRQVDAALVAEDRGRHAQVVADHGVRLLLVPLPPNSATSSYSHSIQYGSVSTSVPSMSHSTAAGRGGATSLLIGGHGGCDPSGGALQREGSPPALEHGLEDGAGRDAVACRGAARRASGRWAAGSRSR